MLTALRRILKLEPKVVIIPAANRDPLTLRERMELREWLATSMTQRALALMEAKHPGTRLKFPSYARSEWDERAAVTFLAKVKGWEMYRDQLLQLADAPKEQREPSEVFPTTE